MHARGENWGVPKLEGPIPSASYLDLRLRKVITLLQAGAAADWSATDRTTAEQAITVMRTASTSVAEALPEVVRARGQERIGLAPAHAETSPALLRYLDDRATLQGPTWRVATMLSNVQALSLEGFPSVLPVTQARRLYEDLVKGPDQGVPALRALSLSLPQGRVFMWSPGDHAQLGRLLSSFQAAAALGLPIPDVSLLTMCDAFPGVTTPETLMDLWRPPSVQDKWLHIRESLELLQEPDRCVVTGPTGPRVVTKSVLVVTMSAAPVNTPALSTSWRPAWLTVTTGPVLLIDGPAEQLHLLQHAAAEVAIPNTLRWEGPLRSRGTTPQDKRVLYKVYFQPGVPDILLDVTTRHLRSHRDLEEFLIGCERLYADPTALRIEVTSMSALLRIRQLAEQLVIVSPRLALAVPSDTRQSQWTETLTNIRRNDPENAVSKVTWRAGHHQGHVFAIPEALPAQVRADRVEEQRRRRPAGVGAHLAELITVTLTGSLGPRPDQLLLDVLAQLNTALSRTLQPGAADQALFPDQYREERHGDGQWSGVLTLRIPCSTETVHLCTMLHGATLDIGSDQTMITAFNPRVDATHSRLRGSGDRGGGRR